MTKFNPENKKTLTYEECLGPAMKITDEADAQQYLTDYVEFIRRGLKKSPSRTGMTAEEIARSNLGYYAGYYDADTRARVERLFCCEHPIFGSIEKNGQPSPEVAFLLGKKAARYGHKTALKTFSDKHRRKRLFT